MNRDPVHHAADERACREIEETLCYYASRPERIGLELDALSREWSLERVLETNASILSLTGLALGMIRGRPRWLLLPAVAAALLLAKGLGGRPPAFPLLRRLGFRPEREIEAERQGCLRLWVAANGGLPGKALEVPPPRWMETGSRGRRSPLLEPRGVAAGPSGEGDGAPAAAPRGARGKPWYRKARYWIPAAIILLAIIFRLLLTPIVESRLRASLERMEGFSASFDDISLSLGRLEIIGHGFTVDRIPPGDPRRPLVEVSRIEVDLFGKPLLSGKLVAQARFIEPKFHIVMTPAAAETGAEPPPPPDAPDISSAMASMVPFRFDRIEIRGGEMTLVDASEKGSPELRIGEIEATIENIETGTQLGRKMPSVFAARAKFQESGEVAMFYTASLLSKALTFAGQARLEGLKLSEINPFIASKTGMKVEKGELDLFTAFSASGGKIAGGVKPLLKHVEMEAWSDELVNKLKSAFANTAIAIFSDRVPPREALAGIIPFSGEITSPDVQVLPAVLSVVRNAFVVGLASGFAHLPPEEAEAALAAQGAGGAGEGK